MPSQPDNQGPIFVGGTGRSGTSVMARLLASHPDIVLPAHENKLIVEEGGLRDLVAQLSERFDMKRHHYAVANFVRWAKKLRTLGFRDAALNERVRSIVSTDRIGYDKAFELVARENPAADLSIHAVGPGFTLEHYDKCLNGFIARICSSVVADGIVDTEGLIRPFFIPHVQSREALILACRDLLDALYALPMARKSAARWCDDTPSNWLYVDFLHELYPNMRFIHMIRDPRDVVGSYIKQVWAPSDPRAVVEIFKAQFADYEKVKSRLPAEAVLELRMEDLSSGKAESLERIAEFLGVEARFDGSIFANDKTNTGSYAEGLGAQTLELIETQLSDWMARHGYLA